MHLRAHGDLIACAEAELSDKYSEEMQEKMQTDLTYRHEAGMNFNRITDDIIVGSCLQQPADADKYASAAHLDSLVLATWHEFLPHHVYT
jgi:hypothetical protein